MDVIDYLIYETVKAVDATADASNYKSVFAGPRFDNVREEVLTVRKAVTPASPALDVAISGAIARAQVRLEVASMPESERAALGVLALERALKG